MHNENTAADVLISLPAHVRHPVDLVSNAQLYTKRSRASTTCEVVPTKGAPFSVTPQGALVNEKISEISIHVVMVEHQQELRRSQIQSMKAEIARLHQQLDIGQTMHLAFDSACLDRAVYSMTLVARYGATQ